METKVAATDHQLMGVARQPEDADSRSTQCVCTFLRHRALARPENLISCRRGRIEARRAGNRPQRSRRSCSACWTASVEEHRSTFAFEDGPVTVICPGGTAATPGGRSPGRMSRTSRSLQQYGRPGRARSKYSATCALPILRLDVFHRLRQRRRGGRPVDPRHTARGGGLEPRHHERFQEATAQVPDHPESKSTTSRPATIFEVTGSEKQERFDPVSGTMRPTQDGDLRVDRRRRVPCAAAQSVQRSVAPSRSATEFTVEASSAPSAA